MNIANTINTLVGFRKNNLTSNYESKRNLDLLEIFALIKFCLFNLCTAKAQDKVCAEIMFILSQIDFDAFTTNECRIATLVYEYVQRIILHSKQFTSFAPTGYNFFHI